MYERFLSDSKQYSHLKLCSKHFPLNQPTLQLRERLLHFPSSPPCCRKPASWLPHTQIGLPSPLKWRVFRVSLPVPLFSPTAIRSAVGRTDDLSFPSTGLQQKRTQDPGWNLRSRPPGLMQRLDETPGMPSGGGRLDSTGSREGNELGPVSGSWRILVSKSSHTLPSDFAVLPVRVGGAHFSASTELGHVTVIQRF